MYQMNRPSKISGVWFDPTSTADEGALMGLNADNTGRQRRLRPNDAIQLNWYRRTEGSNALYRLVAK